MHKANDPPEWERRDLYLSFRAGPHDHPRVGAMEPGVPNLFQMETDGVCI